MILNNLDKYRIILASNSPRRKQLLGDLGVEFEVLTMDTEEVYPEGLSMKEIPVYLAELKAKPFEIKEDNWLVITADTIVWCDGEVLTKPNDADDAKRILQKLSGKKHQVLTGVCIKTKDNKRSFYSSTDVYFKELADNEIDYYIEHYKPFDKAGAYGIQEWIGYIGIEKIEGSYFNVMGLPVQHLYEELKKI